MTDTKSLPRKRRGREFREHDDWEVKRGDPVKKEKILYGFRSSTERLRRAYWVKNQEDIGVYNRDTEMVAEAGEGMESWRNKVKYILSLEKKREDNICIENYLNLLCGVKCCLYNIIWYIQMDNVILIVRLSKLRPREVDLLKVTADKNEIWY